MRYLYIISAILAAACNSQASKETTVTNAILNDSNQINILIDSSQLFKIRNKIKGKWITQGEIITTSFFDNVCVDQDDNSKDSFSYSISYFSCESEVASSTPTKDKIVYLERISKDGDESCFSVENVTDTTLTLMSLGNGNIWTLMRLINPTVP